MHGWNDAYQDRQLAGGDSQPLILGFANNASANANAYTIRVTFLESCSVEFQSGGAPLQSSVFESANPTRVKRSATSRQKGRRK